MKRLIISIIVGVLLFSPSVVMALNLDDALLYREKGIATSEMREDTNMLSVAVRVKYVGDAASCSITVADGYISIAAPIGTADTFGGQMAAGDINLTDTITTVYGFINFLNSDDNYEAEIVDALWGDSIALLNNGDYVYVDTSTYDIGFDDGAAGKTTILSIGISPLPRGESMNRIKVYRAIADEGCTGNLVVYRDFAYYNEAKSDFHDKLWTDSEIVATEVLSGATSSSEEDIRWAQYGENGCDFVNGDRCVIRYEGSQALDIHSNSLNPYVKASYFRW